MEKIFEINLRNRKRLHHILTSTNDDDLMTIPKGFNNNIFWNIAHSLTIAQRLIYGFSGQEIAIPKDFLERYGNGSFPKEKTSEKELKLIASLLMYTAEKTKEDYTKGVFTTYTPFTTSSSKITLHTTEEAIIFNNYHEGMHLGYIFALQKALSYS